MATPTAKRPTPKPVQEVVDPRWILRALAVTVAAAAFCGYLAVCLLIYQGSWQLLLHPSEKIDVLPSTSFQPVRFDAGMTGVPRLTGWWIPAETGSARTILFLHDGSGSLSSNVRELELLHRTGVNVFAIDYRGFGRSEPPHPTEARMNEDARAALSYLEDTRHLPAGGIVPLGEGLGAILALNLVNGHPELAAVIAEDPDARAFDRAMRNGKSRMLPMRMLMQEHFDVAAALSACHTPKLLLADSPFQQDAGRTAENQALFRNVTEPKLAVTFAGPDSRDAYVQALTRFLDEYLR